MSNSLFIFQGDLSLTINPGVFMSSDEPLIKEKVLVPESMAPT